MPFGSFQTNPKANALRVPLLICLKRCFFWNTHNMRIKRHIGGVQPECEMCTCEALFLKANISLCLTKVTMKTKYLSNVSEYVWCQSWFFSCPQQLNRWPCPLVALLPLTIRVFTTLQSDPRDLWPLRHLIRQIFGRFLEFWKIFRFLEDFQIFERFSDFWKIFRFLEDF